MKDIRTNESRRLEHIKQKKREALHYRYDEDREKYEIAVKDYRNWRGRLTYEFRKYLREVDRLLDDEEARLRDIDCANPSSHDEALERRLARRDVMRKMSTQAKRLLSVLQEHNWRVQYRPFEQWSEGLVRNEAS